MKLQWFVIIMSVSTVVTGLAIFILIIRLRGIYCKREIEDIVVYDRRYEQELDFDSQAILTLFFNDIQTYEA